MQRRQSGLSWLGRMLTALLVSALLAAGIGSATADATPPEDSVAWTLLGEGHQLCDGSLVLDFAFAFYTLGTVPEVFADKPPTPPQPPNAPPTVRYIDRWDFSNGCTTPAALIIGLSDGSVVSGAILPGTDRSLGIQELTKLGIRFKVSDIVSLGVGGHAVPPFDFVIAP
jgi:hypothetical protein